MGKLTKPRFMKMVDIQRMLKYVINGEKRPAYIQLNPKPKKTAILLVKDDVTPKMNPNLRKLVTSIENKKILRVQVNEKMKAIDVFKNMFKAIDTKNVSLGVINEQNLSLIEKHDINNLFSYTKVVKNQENFDPKIFETYIKPQIQSKYFLVALDCEMMICENGRQVGRISILDHQGNVIYDKFIKPENTVVDYCEKYSGLNRENTESGISLVQLKEDILKIIGTNTFILGHGLEHDLEVLGLYIEKIIDTSYLFLNTDGHKVKLAHLSKMYFDDFIQKEAHSPIEDAMCCLKLLSYKISELKNFLDSDHTILNVSCQPHCLESTKDLESYEKGVYLIEQGIDETLEYINSKQIPYSIIIFDFENECYIAFSQRI